MPYPQNYTRDEFIDTLFVTVPDPSNPPPEAKDVTPEEMNKLGAGIALNRESLHLSFIRLLHNERNANDPVNSFPVTSESKMSVDNPSWPEAKGTVITVRHKASEVVADIPYDHQEFKANSGNRYFRNAQVIPSATWTWTPNTAYTIGTYVKPTVDNGLYYVCSADGISKATEPTWVTTGSFFETDAGGINPTVQWTVAGSYWSNWIRLVDTTDTADSIGAAPANNPILTGTLTNTPINTTIALATDAIDPSSYNIFVTSSTANLVLNGTPIIADGINGQRIRIANVGVNTFSLTSSATTNLSLISPTLSIPTNGILELTFSSALGQWIQSGAIGLAPSNAPTFTGISTFLGQTTFNNILVNTPKTQVLNAATNQILPTAKTIYINNTTGASLTLTSAPSIPDGVNGQEIEITNISLSNVVVQDQGTLVESNLELNATTRTIGRRGTLVLKYVIDTAGVGQWIEIRLNNVLA